MPIGITLPVTQSTGSIGLLSVTEEEFDAVAQDIHSLLITNWGERVMHYNFGCNFREFLFEPLRNPEFRQMVADRVLSQLETWLPFVVVDQLNVLLEGDSNSIPSNGVGISLTFRLASQPENSKTLEFLVDQNGTVVKTTRLSFLTA